VIVSPEQDFLQVSASTNSQLTNTPGRSPCPLLNTLANHDYLPHSGKDINVTTLLTALDQALNLDLTAKIFFRAQGKKALTVSTTGDKDTFNLFDLHAHNVIEHDGSLSRSDIATGDNWSFNSTIFNETKGYWTDETITVDVAAKALWLRQESAKKSNPAYELPYNQLLNAAGQTAMYLGVFGSYELGDARREWVVSFFENERLPYELGWRRKDDSEKISLIGITGMLGKVVVSYIKLKVGSL
jgi:hypothetical protein